jgi:hypothetical protein
MPVKTLLCGSQLLVEKFNEFPEVHFFTNQSMMILVFIKWVIWNTILHLLHHEPKSHSPQQSTITPLE